MSLRAEAFIAEKTQSRDASGADPRRPGPPYESPVIFPGKQERRAKGGELDYSLS